MKENCENTKLIALLQIEVNQARLLKFVPGFSDVKATEKIIIEMKNAILFSTVFSLCISFFCSKGQGNISPNKILIVYLSRTNNTRAIAEIIQKNIGGELIALELHNPYPENYPATVQQVVKENETGFLPPLKTTIDSIQKYNVVFIGFPTWGMKIPPPVKTFLHQYNLRGKTVIPFNTNAGYGVGTGFQTVKEFCSESNVLDGFTITGGIERDGVKFVMKDEKLKQAKDEVKKWLRKIGMTN